MLRDRYCQLLTAYVDGVLSKRRRKTVLRLLEKSAEARTILQQLQEHAQKLQSLPHVQLPPEFPAQVVSQIGALKPVAKPAPASAGIPTWMGISAAAAVLLAVALGSYFFFRGNTEDPNNRIGPMVNKENDKLQPIDPMIAHILQGTADQFGRPVEVGTRITLANLDKEQQAKLEGQLKKSAAVHLDLTYKTGTPAVERLSQAFEKNGIKILADPKPGAGKAILVYAENVQPRELSSILRQLGQKEGQTDQQFDSVVLDALTDRDRNDVARLMKVDVKEFLPSLRTDLPMFIENPEKPPKAKGKNSGAEDPPRQSERFALVLPMGDGVDQATVQRYMRSRTAWRAGTLQVVVVLHPSA